MDELERPAELSEETWQQMPLEGRQFIALLVAKIAALEARLNQNSSNSSKPPSSDPPSAPLQRYVMARGDIRLRIAMDDYFDARVGARQFAGAQPEPFPDAPIAQLSSRRAQPSGKPADHPWAARYGQRRRNANTVRAGFQHLCVRFSRPAAQHP